MPLPSVLAVQQRGQCDISAKALGLCLSLLLLGLTLGTGLRSQILVLGDVEATVTHPLEKELVKIF